MSGAGPQFAAIISGADSKEFAMNAILEMREINKSFPGVKALRDVNLVVKEGEIATLSVPDHKEVAKGTLRSLIRSAGLTVQEFVREI